MIEGEPLPKCPTPPRAPPDALFAIVQFLIRRDTGGFELDVNMYKPPARPVAVLPAIRQLISDRLDPWKKMPPPQSVWFPVMVQEVRVAAPDTTRPEAEA
jgi:hypothetical protein